jgi:hypothetical protein
MKFFDKLPLPTAKRSKENLSSFHVTTTDFGRLDVPYWTDLVEGDDVVFNCRSFFQAAPMVCPTRGRIKMNVRAFFVPNRILCNKSTFDWDNWINNLSGAAHPYVLESTLEAKTKDSYSTWSIDKKADYRRLLSMLSLPERVYNSTSTQTYQNPERLTIWPFLSYQRIWWDYYRDSNLIDDSQLVNYVGRADAGANNISLFEPLYACFGKDYFTTAKVNPQDGDVTTVVRQGVGLSNNVTGPNPKNILSSGSIVDNSYGLSSGAVPIQFLRAANALQRYLERNNIAGGRVMARFLSRFGYAPDAVRLDQSEYLGGKTYLMQIGGITSPLTNDLEKLTTYQPFFGSDASLAGQVAGKGVIDGNTGIIRYHAKEHGTFMVIATLMPEVGYYQGLHKCWTRGVTNVKQDYLTPEFNLEGLEPIFNKEVALMTLEENSLDNNVWGFQRRYGSYTWKQNVVSNDMVLKETKTGMQSFHLLRSFGDTIQYAPDLTPSFTMLTPEKRAQFGRIFQIPGDPLSFQYDHFEGFHDCMCKITRPFNSDALPALEEDSHSAGKVVTVENGGMRFS